MEHNVVFCNPEIKEKILQLAAWHGCCEKDINGAWAFHQSGPETPVFFIEKYRNGSYWGRVFGVASEHLEWVEKKIQEEYNLLGDRLPAKLKHFHGEGVHVPAERLCNLCGGPHNWEKCPDYHI